MRGGPFFFFFPLPPPSSSLSLSAGSCQDAKLEIAAPDAFCAARRGSSFAGCCQEAGPGPGPRRGPTSAGAPRSRPPRAEHELAGSAGPCGRGRNFRRVPSGGAGAVRAERIGNRCIARPTPSLPAPPSAEGGTAVRRGTPGAPTAEPPRRVPPGRVEPGGAGGCAALAGNRGGSGRTDSADCPPIGVCDPLRSRGSVSHREQPGITPAGCTPGSRPGETPYSGARPEPSGPAAGPGRCLTRVGRARGSGHLPAAERQAPSWEGPAPGSGFEPRSTGSAGDTGRCCGRGGRGPHYTSRRALLPPGPPPPLPASDWSSPHGRPSLSSSHWLAEPSLRGG